MLRLAMSGKVRPTQPTRSRAMFALPPRLARLQRRAWPGARRTPWRALRRTLRLAPALLCVLQLACSRQPTSNVVLITVDTLRSDHLGSYGHGAETSPALDALAKRGVLFLDAIAQATTTPPSHASILTGQNPPTHGLRKLYGQRLPDANRTLAELLQEQGYTTAAFVSAVPLRGRTGLDQGFDLYDDSWEVVTEYDEHERSAQATNERVFAWLDALAPAPRPPVFLWVHYFDPHFPYFPPDRYQRRFGVGPVVREFLPVPVDTNERPRRKPMNPELVERMAALYDAEIAYTDDAIASLLAKLEESGLLTDAAIAVVADHGELLGEYGYFFGHWGVTDETARVPMLLVHPEGRFSGAVVSNAVGTIDLVPTLLSWLGVASDLHFDGRDLTPILEGRTAEPRALYTEQFEYFPVRAVRDEEWILEQRAGKRQRIATGERVLYRRRANGFPRKHSPSHPDVVERLGARMDSVLRPPVKHESEKLQVSPKVRDQLRALGYTDEARGPGDDTARKDSEPSR